MRLFFVLVATLLVTGCVTTVEVNHYPNVQASPRSTQVGLSDSQKWVRIRDRIGFVQYLSRGDILQGTSQNNTAGVMQRRLGRGWVCRQKRQYGVIVVYCARHRKLQRYVRYNNADVFRMELQRPFEFGAAPIYIDWGRR